MKKGKKLAVIVGFLGVLFLTGCGRMSNELMSTPPTPEQVSGFSSQVAYEGGLNSLGVSVRLSWKMDDQSLTGVVIRRSTTSCPQTITQGVLVVEADRNVTSFTDQGLSVNVTYYYSLWTKNSSGQYSENVLTTSVLTEEPDEDAVFAMSKTHALGVLSVQNIVEVSWYSYAISGIAGYSFVWSKNPTANPDETIDTTKNSTVSPPLADGVWYFHIKAKNNAGVWGSSLHYGPFYINSGSILVPEVTIATSNPASSTSEFNWTSKNNVTISWITNLSDADIAGYSYEFSAGSSTEPDDTSEGTAKSTIKKLSDGVWYFHVKGKNSVGEWGNTAHYGPYRINASVPATPEVKENIVFINMNPGVGEWSVASTAYLKWQYIGTGTASEYNYVWDKYSTTVPGATSKGTGTESTSPTLTDGDWYFHIRALTSGKWTQTTHCGPFRIDTVPPQPISNVQTAPSVGKISFKWAYPSDTSVAGTVVVRNSTRYPNDINDGLMVFSDNNDDFMDVGLVDNTNYYYSFWTVDGAGNYSSKVNVVAQAYDTYADVDTRVDSVVTGDQRNSQVAKFGDGSFVVLYLSKAQAADLTEYEDLYAEVYDANATKTVQKVKLNIGQPINSDYSVSALTNGNFVVAWSVNRRDVYVQVFSKLGAAITSATKVSSAATYEQRNASVAGLSSGYFVVAWQAGDGDENPGPDGDRRSVQARMYNANATPRAAEFTVNQWKWENQQRPAVSSYSGGFVIAWESKKKDSVDETWGGYGIAARRYNSSGVALGDEFLVNETMRYKDQKWANVIGLSGGGFAIAWQSGDSGNPPSFFHGIYARAYNSAGVAQGTEFVVRNAQSDAILPIEDNGTASPFDDELGPNMLSLGALSDGGFVIAYDNINGVDKDASNRGNGYGIFTKKYTSAGAANGSQIQINRYCVGDQKEPQVVGLNSAGQYFVVWESRGQNEGITDSGVYGRKL